MKKKIISRDNGHTYVYDLPEYVVLPNGGIWDLLPIVGAVALLLFLL